MDKNWSNAALVAYSHLPKFVKDIDLGVKNRVLSTYQSQHLKNGVTTEQLIGEIMALNDEKRKIINLRLIVSETLNAMNEKDRNLLVARVIKRHTFQHISDEFGISLRTTFRRIENAASAFSEVLRKRGFTDGWFLKEYGDDKYIYPIYERILKEKYSVAKNM